MRLRRTLMAVWPASMLEGGGLSQKLRRKFGCLHSAYATRETSTYGPTAEKYMQQNHILKWCARGNVISALLLCFHITFSIHKIFIPTNIPTFFRARRAWVYPIRCWLKSEPGLHVSYKWRWNPTNASRIVAAPPKVAAASVVEPYFRAMSAPSFSCSNSSTPWLTYCANTKSRNSCSLSSYSPAMRLFPSSARSFRVFGDWVKAT